MITYKSFFVKFFSTRPDFFVIFTKKAAPLPKSFDHFCPPPKKQNSENTAKAIPLTFKLGFVGVLEYTNERVVEDDDPYTLLI